MARIFTTLFSYKGNAYTAVITQLDDIVKIYVPDESLHNIFPGGRATFNPQEGHTADTSGLNQAQELVLHIRSSIEKQIKIEHSQKE